MNRLLSILSPLVLLGLWELGVAVGWLNRVFYPPPSEVFVTFGKLVADGTLATDVGISMLRVGLGFVLGGVPAIAVGLLMGINGTVRAIVRPLAAAIYPIPKIALLPLIIVALGIGETSKIATIAISVFFLVVLNVAASVMQIDASYFEVARSFGARGGSLFWTVALPASLPGIMESVKIGMGFALTLIVGVEFVGAQEGIGHLIWNAYEVYAIDRMLAGVIAVALVGWVVTLALDELEVILVPWRTQALTRRKVQRPTVAPAPPAAIQSPARSTPITMRTLLSIWWRTLRPWSYTAAVIPVLLGGCLAAWAGHLNVPVLLLAVVGSIAIQAGANLMNDYYDFTRGTDTPQVQGTGGALIRGDLTPRQIFIAGVVAFIIGSAIGLYMVAIAGQFILWLGIVSVICAYAYTGGPYPLAYNGLGEIAVFIFMGPVMVVGSYYVQTQQVTWPVILASLPVSFLVAAILHANNLRDIDTDRVNGKRTLATILGRQGARWEYYLLIGGTYLSLLGLVIAGIAPPLTLVTLVTLPLALRLVRIAGSETEAPKLQPVLRQTAALHRQFGLLLVAGWFVAYAASLLLR